MLTVLLALLLVAVGCGEPEDPLAPPDIAYGVDICEQCGMIISDERFAAAAVVDAGGGPETRAFDDIGDLLAYAEAHPELEVRRWYVHDYETLEWIDATEASYVRAPGIDTPMDSDLAAFADRDRAAAMAAELEEAEVLAFDALRDMGHDEAMHDHPED